ncbi:MAG: choice-of-anchor C family protein [Janthinobacterium lividum]
MRVATLAFTAAALLAGTANAATLITNGSFETNSLTSIPAIGYATLYAGQSTASAITGWKVTAGNVDYIKSYWQAAAGSYSVDLSGFKNGSISQTLTTVVGKTYHLTFDESGNPDGKPVTKTAAVSINGAQLSDYTYVTGANSHENMEYATVGYTFTALSTSSVLKFANVGPNSPYGPVIDNVAVVVPEPAAWAMMIAGFSMVGFAARRRRAVRTVAA